MTPLTMLLLVDLIWKRESQFSYNLRFAYFEHSRKPGGRKSSDAPSAAGRARTRPARKQFLPIFLTGMDLAKLEAPPGFEPGIEVFRPIKGIGSTWDIFIFQSNLARAPSTDTYQVLPHLYSVAR